MFTSFRGLEIAMAVQRGVVTGFEKRERSEENDFLKNE